MRLVLDPAEDAAHGDWLRETLGAYEWWYFDALSENGEWALTCIWFLGNPFSPYYRLAAQGRPADPFSHNALFFALYRRGRLYAYHFTRFPIAEVAVAERAPGALRFGPNLLTTRKEGGCRLQVIDENANRRILKADLHFSYSPLVSETEPQNEAESDHFWLPAAPACRVSGRITLRAANNFGAEEIAFSGRGYHDHNWGRLPFAADIRDWYWARASLDRERAAILYHVRLHGGRKPVSHLLLFEGGRLLLHDPSARVCLSHLAINGFGMIYARQLAAESGPVHVRFRLRSRLDSAPFYLRALCEATVEENGKVEIGSGIGEYFRPRILSWPLVASAMKARIVEQ